MSFLDNLFRATRATELATTGDPVDVSAAAPPVTGYVLKATDATHSTWQAEGAAVVAPGDAPYSDEFVAGPLDPKWLEWNPGGFTMTAGVNDDLHMASLEVADGNKRWAGILQEMPVATEGNPTFVYTISTRVLMDMITAEAPYFDYQEVQAALVLGEDLIGSDESPLVTVMARHTAEYAGGLLTATSDCVVGDYAAFDMNNAGASVSTMQSWQIYLRARVQVFGPATVVTFQCSPTGETWQTLAELSLDYVVLHAGFGLRSEQGFNVRALMDHFRVVLEV